MAGLLYSSLVSNQALEAGPPVKSGKEKTDSSSQQTDSEFVQSQAEPKKLIEIDCAAG